MLISVVTITFNDLVGFKKTFESVSLFNDTSSFDVEYVVINGGEELGIDSMLRSSGLTTYYVNESDSGIYDAMNKGISNLSDKSDFVIFMNAGDSFTPQAGAIVSQSDLSALANVFYITSSDEYGNSVKIRRIKTIDDIRKWPCYPHQATFIDSHYHKQHPYLTKFRILADYNFFTELYANTGNVIIHHHCIADFLQGGVSNNSKTINVFIDELKFIQLKQFNRINHFLVCGIRLKLFISRLPLSSLIIKFLRNFIR